MEKVSIAAPTPVLGKRSREDGESGEQEAQDPSKLYQCGDCRKSYSRVDHLARHVRLHTKEKPYLCQICGKGFARADLLKRHVVGHEARGDQQQAQRSSPNRQGRVGKACEACAELHLKCDDQKPCARCKKKRITCLYQPSPPPPDTEAGARDLLSLAQNGGHGLIAGVIVTEPPLDQLQTTPVFPVSDDARRGSFQNSAQPPPSLVEGVYSSGNLDDGFNNERFEPQEDPLPPDSNLGTDGTAMHEFLQTIMSGADAFSSIPAAGNISGTWTPRNVFDFGQNTSLELNDMDLSFLDDYNQHNPFVPYVETPETVHSMRGSTASDPPSALGAESLQRASTWRFRPVSHDTGASDQQNLSLPVAATNTGLRIERRVFSETLSYNMRDRILALIISSCKEGNVPRTVLSFPSLDLLDSLLQFYLTSKAGMSNNFVHTPTLSLSRARPELVAAMTAAGATLAPDGSLRKVGYAIMEALRTSVPHLIEEDNSLIADIQCLQCLAICLNIGLWSGNSRKMEIAESFLQPYLTMIRRRGWFRRSAYESVAPTPEDFGSQLEDKWRRWAGQESRKRLAFHFFQHDTKQSLSLFTNPLVSYAELGLPLPEAQALWLAPNAEQWKKAYLTVFQHQRTPSLVDLLQNVDLLGESHGLFDERIADEALLGAAWGLIWEYRQLCSIMQGQTSQWSNSSLLLSSRLTELTKLLDCIRMSAHGAASTTLFLELLLMHLHVSLEEVHLFAGAEGHDEARRVYPHLQDWVKTPGSRDAVFHAAQIVACARKVASTCLRDFLAIAVYQASLALWSYGVVSNAAVAVAAASSGSSSSSAKTQQAARPPESVALLDESDSNGAQRFIALNRGQAAIRGPAAAAAAAAAAGPMEKAAPGPHVLLTDPGAVMGVLMDILKANHKASQSRPNLVDNLLELMGGLKAAVSMGSML